MPYNIDTWRTKELENLQVPLSAFFKSDKKDWWPVRKWSDEKALTLIFCGAAEILGDVVDGIFHIVEIEFCGEGSGTSMWEVFEPALKESTGKLIASLVWEGGDSINKIIVRDGQVEWEDIEI